MLKRRKKKMNKRIVLAITMLVLVLTSSLVMTASAATDITLTWAGNLGFLYANDDADVGASSAGGVTGLLHLNDLEDNPYSYGVDTIRSDIYATILGGGEVDFSFDRTDSGPYGPADQSTYSYLGTDGTGQLIFRTRTNYADLDSSNYGFQANDQFQADAMGGSYAAYHEVTNGDLFASFLAQGDGTVDIDHMTDDTWDQEIKFGWGCGCYTNADVTITGAGLYEREANFLTSLNVASGGSASGAGSWVETWTFGSGFSMGDTSFTVK